jgi:hypothetical protein
MLKTSVRRAAARFAFAGALAALAGCVVYDPYPYGYAPAPGPSTFDRSWNAASAAVRDQGVQITSEDRSSGMIQGRRGGVTVTASVMTQADGRVRVGFTSGGNVAEDPDLPDRLARSYESRMGR